MTATVNRIRQAIINRLRLDTGIDAPAEDIALALLEPAEAAKELASRAQRIDESRAGWIAENKATAKRHEQAAADISKRLAVAIEKREAIRQQLREADTAVVAVAVEQHNESYRAGKAIHENETKLRDTAAPCIAAALERCTKEIEAMQRGEGRHTWEEDRGPVFPDSARFIVRGNSEAFNARLTALRAARQKIAHELPVQVATAADMEAAIDKLFNSLPSID